jgi:ABC-type transporter MlaC component
MAVRQLLYDAALADEQRYQTAYRAILENQFGVFLESLKNADVSRMLKILQALSEPPATT